VLSATDSVEYLVAFAALTWIGALFSPLFGVAGDRLGVRALLCWTRAAYALIAAALTALTLTGTLQPWHAFVLFGISGLMRPSDQALRSVLVGQTMQPEILMSGLGLSRMTADMAKVLGAFAGAGGVALIGMGAAYVIVTLLYVSAFILTLGVARTRSHAPNASAARAVHRLAEAAHYVWRKPDLLGAFSIAFLVNLLAFPFVLGLLPYAAREVFDVGQTGLGYMAAAFAFGALAGSLTVGSSTLALRAGRTMLASSGVWFIAVLAFGQTRSLTLGLALLFLCGVVQSFCMAPLAAVMLRASREDMRSRVMGIRVLGIWGLPLGLVASGPVIAHAGYSACTVLYAGLGLIATLVVAYRWRGALWHTAAPANSI
jgi:predicted MFS family arabinose efflux permease